MHNSLEDDERRDLARARDSAAKIGEEVLSRIVQWSEKTPDESQASPQERSYSSPHQLSPELRKRLARAAAGNTTIHTSLPNNTSARLVHEPGDGFNTIGDILPKGEWVLPHEIVDEASWSSGLHLQGATESDMRIGMPELVCFVPKTEQKPKEPAKKRMFGADIPATYEEVDATTRNPNTGHEEPVVNFIYSYNPRRIKDISLEQELMHQDPRTGRMGNLLEIAVSLPKSEADDLQKELVKDPVKVRAFVEELVKTRGNIAPGEWDGSTTERKLGVRPPVFVDKPGRSPQARQLAAKPRIIVPTTDKAAGRAFSQRVFRLVA